MDILFMALSLLLGILPESLFFTIFIIFAKGLTEKRIKLFGLILLVNAVLSVVFMMFVPHDYSIWYHVLLMVAMYLILRLLYKSHIIDIFLITFAAIIIMLSSYLWYFTIPNYWAALAIDRVVLIALPIISRASCKKLYNGYLSVWDRKQGAKIKSVTVRNISCIALNLLLFVIHISLTYVGEYFMKGGELP